MSHPKFPIPYLPYAFLLLPFPPIFAPLMDYRELRIVFMGTPEFAVASLDALVKAGCRIAGVITAPGKPAGRGMKLQESAVKKYALEHGLHILQPPKLKDPQFLEELRSLNADLQIVVAFRMLPEVVWNMPPMGTLNVHGSLLPQYRGAAPINWAIINGEKETGVTTFRLKHEIDTGNILLQEKIPIGENETAGELHDRMKETGAQLLVRTVVGLAEGTISEVEQSTVHGPQSTDENSKSGVQTSMPEGPDTGMHHTPSAAVSGPSTVDRGPLRHAPKIFTDTCRIDWNKPVEEVHNLVRGLSPFPGAFTTLQDKMLKIYRSEKDHTPPALPPGGVQTDHRSFLKFTCSNGHLIVKELQLEGKKKMPVEEFLKGYRG
jgi:methionyl-tRNA formyltransferase